MNTALELRNISKRFGDTLALSDASLVVRSGSIHALVGENGAGKTTLMRVAFGMLIPDGGTILLRGEPRVFARAADALAAGVGMVHQHFTLVPSMTVRENLQLGGRGLYDPQAASRDTQRLAEETGFTLDALARVDTLPIGSQQRLEIARAVARNPSLLILDEPTAVLAPSEVNDLLRWLRSYAHAGHAVVIITHKLHEALRVADDVTVMRAGRVVSSGEASDMTQAQLTAAMLGEALTPDLGSPQSNVQLEALIKAENLRLSNSDSRSIAQDLNIEVRAGELVGIAAIEGFAQHELLRVLSGRSTPAEGTLVLPDNVGFIPEDRHRDAVLLDRSLTENVALRGASARSGRVDWKSVRAHTQKLLTDFDVRSGGESTVMRFLSGGNQQKLVLARELVDLSGSHARAIIADNPTRGLDIRATAAVHARLRHAAEEGAAVIFYSSDIDEVISLATRVLVLRDGHLIETARDRDAVGRAMLASATPASA